MQCRPVGTPSRSFLLIASVWTSRERAYPRWTYTCSWCCFWFKQNQCMPSTLFVQSFTSDRCHLLIATKLPLLGSESLFFASMLCVRPSPWSSWSDMEFPSEWRPMVSSLPSQVKGSSSTWRRLDWTTWPFTSPAITPLSSWASCNPPTAPPSKTRVPSSSGPSKRISQSLAPLSSSLE